jgi:hypothetical protein
MPTGIPWSVCRIFRVNAVNRLKGVPRILENTLPDHLAAQFDEPQWAHFAEYMATTRININVRQVFPKGFEAPVKPDTGL